MTHQSEYESSANTTTKKSLSANTSKQKAHVAIVIESDEENMAAHEDKKQATQQKQPWWKFPGYKGTLTGAFMTAATAAGGTTTAFVESAKAGTQCADKVYDTLSPLFDHILTGEAKLPALKLMLENLGIPNLPAKLPVGLPSGIPLSDILGGNAVHALEAFADGLADTASSACETLVFNQIVTWTLIATATGGALTSLYYLNAQRKAEYRELKKELQGATNAHGGIPSTSSRDNSPLLRGNDTKDTHHRRTQSSIR